MKKIKTYEQACEVLQMDPTRLPVVTGLPARHQKALTAHFKLIIIVEALNEGWKPNWKDWDETKYYPWFEMDTDSDTSPGSGFSFLGCDNDYSGSVLGSRLCFKTRELAEYAGKQFEELYKEYMHLTN